MKSSSFLVLASFLLLVLAPAVMATSPQVINDSRAFISSDYELERPADINSVFMTKLYTGNISIGFLFDTDISVPSNARLVTIENLTVENALTCEHDIDYELNPNYAWCMANGTIKWNRSFDRGDLPTKTIYWDVFVPTEVETNINNYFTKTSTSLFGYNTLYYVEDVPMTANVARNMRFRLNFPYGVDVKYDVIAFPSSYGDDLVAANIAGVLYRLDPLVNSTTYHVGHGTVYDWSSDADNASTNVSYFNSDLQFRLGFEGAGGGYGANITAHYSYNTSLTLDNTGNGHTGISVGSGYIDTNNFKLGGGSANLTPASSFVKIPSINLTESDKLAFAFWFRGYETFDTNDDFMIAHDGNGTDGLIIYREGSTDTLIFKLRNTGLSVSSVGSTMNLSNPVWHFACGAWDGTSMFLMINDTLQGTQGFTGPIRPSPSGVYIGKRQQDVTQNGIEDLIDEISFWYNTSITQTDCQDMYNSGAGRYYEDFDQGSYDPGKNVFTSEIFNISDSMSAVTPTLNFSSNGYDVNMTFTCDANETATYSSLISNGVVNSCPVNGDSFQYQIVISGNTTLSAQVNNLTVNFQFNQAPNLTTPILSPLSPTVVDDITANTTYVDPDGDSGNVTFVWNVNGSFPFNETFNVVNGSTVNSTLLALYTSSGELVNVTVFAYDNNSNFFGNLTSATVNISGVPPPSAENLTYLFRNKTAINYTWDNPSSSLWNFTQVWFNGSNVLNTSGETYNATGLSPGVVYEITLFTVGDDGAVNNTGISLNVSTLNNTPPNLTRVEPVNVSVSMGENESLLFNVTATDDDGGNLVVSWIVDGIKKLGEIIASGASTAYNYVTGFFDSGSHNVTVEINDSFDGSSTLEWNVTVVDTFPVPATPIGVNPDGGGFEYSIPLVCELGEIPGSSFVVQYQYKVNDSGWTDLNINDSDVYYEFDIANDAYGTNYSFRCNVTTVGGASNFSDSTANITKINLNHLYMFVPSGGGDYQHMRPYTVGFVAEADNNIGASIAALFVDCTGNGVWDYGFDYRDDNITSKRDTVQCLNARGEVQHTIGMVLFKNNTASWETLGCTDLDNDDLYCAVYKNYELVIQ